MNKILAAIIDDGACPDLFAHSESIFVNDSGELEQGDFSEHYCGHATDCMAVINKYNNSDNTFWYNIGVIDEETGKGSIDHLIKALEFCYQKNVKIIHMSIGTSVKKDFHLIEEIINKMTDKGTIIVAAQSNADIITYPAFMPNVIGVKECSKLKDDHYAISNNTFDNINYCSCSEHNITLFDVDYITQKCNSMAAPVITAKIISMLEDDISLKTDNVVKALNEKADCTINESRIEKYKDFSENSIEIPVIGLLLSDKNAGSNLSEKLCGLFEEDGYYSEISSPEKKGYCHLPDSNIAEYIVCISDFCKCDLVIINFNNPDLLKKFNSFDILIVESNYLDFIPENEIIKIITVNNINYKEIYREIMDNLLSEENDYE